MTNTNLSDGLQDKPVKLFSLRGRIGRVRYIVFSLGALVVAFMFTLMTGLFAVQLPESLGRMLYTVVSVLLFYALLPIFFAVMTVKRSHDFNMGGWLALLMLVPLVNLVFWFIPGTRGENKYGMQGAPEPAGLTCLAIVLPLLFVGSYLLSTEVKNSQADSATSSVKPPTTLKSYAP